MKSGVEELSVMSFILLSVSYLLHSRAFRFRKINFDSIQLTQMHRFFDSIRFYLTVLGALDDCTMTFKYYDMSYKF